MLKRLSRLSLCVLCSHVMAFGEQPATGPTETRQTNLTILAVLADGSRIHGTPSLQTMPLATSMGTINIPLSRIRQITGTATDTNLVSLVSGDRLTGSFSWTSLSLNTLFGPVSIDRSQIIQLTVLAGSGNLPAPLREGLILHYVFDRNENRSISDKSEQGRTGTSHDAAYEATPPVGDALLFNGQTTHVDFSAETFPTETSPRTLAAWVRQDTINEGRFYVFGYGGDTRGSEFRIALNEFSPGQFSLETWGCGWHANTALKPKRWYHLAITYSGQGTPKFYANGKEVSTGGTWGAPIIRTEAAGGALGMRRNQEGGGYLKGRIAEVAAWNRALQSEEIRALHELRPDPDADKEPISD